VADVREMFARVPEGWSTASYDGRRWGVTRSVGSDGRSQWLLAEELGGSDLVSANLYRVGDGDVLRPCEMPEQKVLAFLAGLTPEAGPA
jgi:hypothetical protein